MSVDAANGAEPSESPEIRTGGSPPPSAAPPKRGPGRPRKDGTAPGSARIGETPVGNDTGKPRGRPKKERVELDRAAIARQLLGSHMMVGSMLGMPEFFLTEKEAEQMAEAVCDFAHEYDFEPDPKLMAIINLAATAGFIYVPKVIRVAVRIKKAKAGKGQTIDGEASEVKNESGTPAN